ncbi:prephenate/arogenate dehydrogenase family protein [Curvivirga sp.]|uniref:prephenate/arogenate dehydrogenase family protein n=1 Tax=Curvivirga sp. TaxID=2856848 RepID=UPI003B5BD37E
MTSPMFEKVTFIGLGLIGSSMARAMKRDNLAGHIVGSARSEETRNKSLELGFIDSAEADPAKAVEDADLVVLCAPLGANAKIAEAMAPGLKRGAIVTDVGSSKMKVIEDVEPHLPEGVHLVPGHPIAGTENSGPASGFAELFDGRYCLITPADSTDRAAFRKVVSMWKEIGAIVDVMSPKHHDRVLAITSHLPHLIAYTIVGTAADLEGHLEKEDADIEEMVETNEVVRFSGSGFRDFTRIAGSDPVMWRDVFLANKDAVLEMLGRFTEDLVALQRAIRWNDADQLEDWFTRTRKIRREVVEQPARSPYVDWQGGHRVGPGSED